MILRLDGKRGVARGTGFRGSMGLMGAGSRIQGDLPFRENTFTCEAGHTFTGGPKQNNPLGKWLPPQPHPLQLLALGEAGGLGVVGGGVGGCWSRSPPEGGGSLTDTGAVEGVPGLCERPWQSSARLSSFQHQL